MGPGPWKQRQPCAATNPVVGAGEGEEAALCVHFEQVVRTVEERRDAARTAAVADGEDAVGHCDAGQGREMQPSASAQPAAGRTFAILDVEVVNTIVVRPRKVGILIHGLSRA